MNNIDTYQFSGKRVLVRVDFNVPLNEKLEITDDTRIVTAIPTIRKILTEGGSVILLTHLGRPDGKYNDSLSVKHIVPHLSKKLHVDVKFAEDPLSSSTVEMSKNLEPGEVMIVENLRFYPEEKRGDEGFAESLSKLGDAYVMEAFGTAHRAHASTCTIANYFPYDKMLGYLVENEIQNIDKVIKKAERPFTAIVGGSKVSTKIHIIEALLEKVDNLIIGGAIIFTFIKAKGGNVGASLVEEDYIDVAKRIMEKAELKGVKLHLPSDCIIADKFSNDANIKNCATDAIESGWMGLDIGIKSANKFSEIIEQSSTILWNGPIGVFEMSNFSTGTLKVALAVARATDKGAYSLIGGGDSIAAVNKYSLAHKVSYISTAGGALLEYIEGKKLPGIKAVKDAFSVDDYNFNGKRALVRVDFNVPLDSENNITDDTRIITAIPTIRKILTDGGSVILLTHLGRPKGEKRPEMSVKHIIPHISKLMDCEVKFAEDCYSKEAADMAANLKGGDIMMLENLRFDKRETSADDDFAKQLASLGDVYVNNAFGTAHRAHASTYTIAKYFPKDKMLGYLIESEIQNINKAIQGSQKPFTAILGGSKVSTKIHIIEALLEKVDNLIIGGGIIFTFIKAMGGNVGSSLVEDDYIDVAKSVIDKAKEKGVKLYLPSDCIVADKFSNDANIKHCDVMNIEDGWMGLDVGIKSANLFEEVIENSQTILWNGPIGVFEMPNFSLGTLKVAMAVARATDKGAFSLIGGGDSIAAVNMYSLAHKISYISTAGGALLEYIEGKELPGIKAITKKI
jgi:phosphoglycerate kinase